MYARRLSPRKYIRRGLLTKRGVGLAGAGLLADVIAHEAGPGFTFPEIGPVDYGYWELKVTAG